MSIEVSYYSFSPSRAESGWERFEKDYQAIIGQKVRKDQTIILDEWQKDLYDNSYAGDIFYEEKPDEETILYGLKAIDLYYGGTLSEYFESPKAEFTFVEKLARYWSAKTEGTLPTKEEWIRIFENMDAKSLKEVASLVAKGIGWDEEEALHELVDYLKAARPVIKDLKETADSVFVRWYGGDSEAEPESSEKILAERAKKHAERFGHIFGGVKNIRN